MRHCAFRRRVGALRRGCAPHNLAEESRWCNPSGRHVIARGEADQEVAADREETPMILEHATWFLFAWVFCNQAGIPLPVIPALVGAGALAGNGQLELAVIVGIAVGAALAADLIWYGLGRWRGAQALKTLGRLAPIAGML